MPVVSLQLVYIMCILIICWICPFMQDTHRHNLSHTNNAYVEVVFDQIGSEKNMLVKIGSHFTDFPKIGSPPQDWITSPRLQVKIVQPFLKAPQLYTYSTVVPSFDLPRPTIQWKVWRFIRWDPRGPWNGSLNPGGDWQASWVTG